MKLTPSKTRPVITTLDIETAPLKVWAWGLWDQNTGLEQIGDEWTILSFAAKRLGEDKIDYMDTGGWGRAKVRSDRQLLKRLWQILDDTDIVIAQNGQSFDLRKINARLLMHNFLPYSPIRIIDTKLAAQRYFAFTSNKLAWLGKHLTNSPKDEHHGFPGFELWAECLKDNPRAWREMKKYNIQDVLATEKVYLKMRPWIEGHPNVATYGAALERECPRCGSRRIRSAGLRRTQVGVYQRFRCLQCGGYARHRRMSNTISQRDNLLVQ